MTKYLQSNNIFTVMDEYHSMKELFNIDYDYFERFTSIGIIS